MSTRYHKGIQYNDVITIEYSVRVSGGRTVYSSEDDGPLTFRVGSFKLIRGLNKAVLGMKVGEIKKVCILPLEAFGEVKTELKQKVLLSNLPKFIKEGDSYFDKVKKAFFNVLSVDSESGIALIDGNHLLAGYILDFSIKILGSPNLPEKTFSPLRISA